MHSLQFKLSSVLPGSKPSGKDSNIQQALHVFFPITFNLDTTNKKADAVSVSGISSAITLTGATEYEVDSSLTYNELCQVYLCFLIRFNSEANIQPSTIEIKTSNLLNPESVALTGPISITSMMKYT